MQKERTITHRNVCGAFIGGLVGILAFGYFGRFGHYALPIGCFFGVVLGWCYGEIWQHMCQTKKKITMKLETWNNRFETWLHELTMPLSEKQPGKSRFSRKLQEVVLIMCILPKLPGFGVRWLRANKTNQARALAFAAVVVFAIVNVSYIFPLLGTLGTIIAAHDHKDGLSSLLFVCTAMISCAIIAVSFLAPVLYPVWQYRDAAPSDIHKAMLATYLEWGPVGYFLSETTRLLLAQIRTALVATAWVGWCCIVCMDIETLGALMIIVATGICRGISFTVTKGAYWSCFLATLTVTVVTAWQTEPYLHNQTVLWIVALGAGCISAFATEVLRRVIARALRASRLAQKLIEQKLEDTLEWWTCIPWEWTKRFGSLTIKLLPISI